MRVILFLLLVIVSSGFAFGDAFATVTIVPAAGSGSPGCDVSSNCYIPNVAYVDVGETIIFLNTDSAAHTFTSGTTSGGPDGNFDSGMLVSGNSFSYTPFTSGGFPYFCMLHPWMLGGIIVQDASPVITGTIITLDPSKSSIIIGSIILFSGQLLDENGISISGKMIFVQGNSDTGRGQGKSAITDSSGRYTVELDNWRENDIGTWTIYAEFEGDSQYKKSSSNSRQLEITLSEYVDSPVSEEDLKAIDDFLKQQEVQYPGSAPYGTNIIIPRDTGSPGCENSYFCYSPYIFSTNEGETVTWYNADSAAHTVTSGSPTDGPSGVFDSSMLMSGNSFSITLHDSGEYPYFCMLHPWMNGILVVEIIFEEPKVFPSSISIRTDRTSYDSGDRIKISGTVTNSQSGIPASIIVKAPSGNIVSIHQSTVSYGGSFSTEITAGGSLMRDKGTYKIVVQYGTENVSDSSSFYFSGDETYQSPPPIGTNVITPDSGSGSSYDNCLKSQYGCYSPGIATVSLGDVVTFSNTDSAVHTFSAGNPSDGPTGEFDAYVIAGSSYQWTANVVGEIPYFCMVHPWMNGLLIVTGGYVEPPEVIPPKVIPPTYTQPVTIPTGTNVVIPSGTGAPGCESSNSCYEPRIFIAGKYSTVTWFNSDSAAHTVTSGTPSRGTDGEFDSGLFMSGESFSHRFTDDGTYNYFCMVHPWMEGKIAITRSGTIYEAPTPTPTYTPPTYTPPTYTPPTYTPPTPTPIEKLTTRIVIDQIQDTAYLGDNITISGKLTANGKVVPNAEIHIKDLDSFDTDDLIGKIMTDINGRFSMTWTVKGMESNDRVVVSNVISQISSFSPDISIQIAGQATPIINNFKNAVEESTVEFFAHYPGGDKHSESFSCGSSTVHFGILFKCNEPKILVILSNENSSGDRVFNQALVNLLPVITTLTDDSLFLSLVGDKDKGKTTQIIEDSLHESINFVTGEESNTLEDAFIELNGPKLEKPKQSCFLFWCW